MAMRFVVLVKANKDSEAGVLPTQALLAEMGKFNDELVKAGVMLAGEGVQARSQRARVTHPGHKRPERDGPSTRAKGLAARVGVWDAEKRAEALEWAHGIPFH